MESVLNAYKFILCIKYLSVKIINELFHRLKTLQCNVRKKPFLINSNVHSFSNITTYGMIPGYCACSIVKLQTVN